MCIQVIQGYEQMREKKRKKMCMPLSTCEIYKLQIILKLLVSYNHFVNAPQLSCTHHILEILVGFQTGYIALRRPLKAGHFKGPFGIKDLERYN